MQILYAHHLNPAGFRMIDYTHRAAVTVGPLFLISYDIHVHLKELVEFINSLATLAGLNCAQE